MTLTFDFDAATEQAEQDALDAMLPVQEDTHTPEDEAFYCESILSGEYDEDQAEREGEYLTDEFFDEWESRLAGDRWERNFWGD